MRFDVVTLFPGYFASPFDESLVGRAVDSGILDIHLVDLRDFTNDPHRKVDDEPYGGGPGMVLTAPPVFAAVEALRREPDAPAPHVVFLSPQGRRFDTRLAKELAARPARGARLRPVRRDRREDTHGGPLRRGDLARGLRPVRRERSRRSRSSRPSHGTARRRPGRRQRGRRQLRGRASRLPALQPPAFVPRPRRARGAVLGPSREDPALAERAAAPRDAREAARPPRKTPRSTRRKGNSWRDLRGSRVPRRIALHG